MKLYHRVVACVAFTITILLSDQGVLAVEPTPFVNHARFVPSGPNTFSLLFEPGPFAPETGLPATGGNALPGWNPNVEASVEGGGGPPSLDETTLIATIPVLDTITSIAHNENGDELGRLILLATGNQKLDLNAGNAVVDTAEGTIAVQFGGPLLNGQPSATLELVEQSGIYESNYRLHGNDLEAIAGGHFLLALDDAPETSLQENILTAFSTGQLVGIDVLGVWRGNYVPEPASSLLLLIGAGLGAGTIHCRRSQEHGSKR